MLPNQISVKPKDAELQMPSAMVKVYFVGYEMYAAVQGNPGVIISKQKPFAYPPLGEYIVVPRTVGLDLESKSRWNGVETLVLEEHGGAEMAKLVKQHYDALVEEFGIDAPEFQKKVQFKRGMTREDYEREVEEHKEFQRQILAQFYARLKSVEVERIIFDKKKRELTDDEILQLMAERGLTVVAEEPKEMSDEALLELLAQRNLLPNEEKTTAKAPRRSTKSESKKEN